MNTSNITNYKPKDFDYLKFPPMYSVLLQSMDFYSLFYHFKSVMSSLSAFLIKFLFSPFFTPALYHISSSRSQYFIR